MEYMKKKIQKTEQIQENNNFYKLDKFYAKDGCFYFCSLSKRRNYVRHRKPLKIKGGSMPQPMRRQGGRWF